MKRDENGGRPVYLGLECGATRTTARAESCGGPDAAAVMHAEFGPANLRLLTDPQLIQHFRSIARVVPAPSAVAVGMAGARTEADRRRIRAAVARAWPGVPCHPTHDLETALAAADPLPDDPRFRTRPVGSRNLGRRDGRDADRLTAVPRVLVLSGTGSCCYGQTPDGRTSKVGGWGHILGDKGSAHEIGMRALKAVVYYYDRDGEWSALGQRVLRALMLNEPDDLIDWVRNAGKDEVARLALEVFDAWARRDAIAEDILTGAAAGLAKDAAACARNLAPRGGPVQFVFAGGVLLKQPRFARRVRRELETRWPDAIVTLLRRSGAEGAVELAKRHFPPGKLGRQTGPSSVKARLGHAPAEPAAQPEVVGVGSLAASPTEQRNPRSMDLDRMSIGEAIELMLGEEARLPKTLRAERRSIEHAIRLIVRSFRRGGRLFYVGAGTSGRLGVLDASECPPTFRTDPELVQGIIAGGQIALWTAVEGAEDDPDAGARAVRFRNVTGRDVVVGIAASGRTPFVWGALGEAKRRGASTILICFNPALKIPARQRPAVVIAPAIGPEILTGSTRLKAGTATKLVLNMFTTLAMVRLGKVRSNLMIDVKASNVKLRDRATRIVQELTGADAGIARAALLKHDWNIQRACARLKPRR